MAIEIADKLYTSTQVADILGVSLRTLYRYMEDHKIQSMRTASGRHRFTKQQILDFLNAGEYIREYSDGNQPQMQPMQQRQQYPQQQFQGQNYQQNPQLQRPASWDPYNSQPMHGSQTDQGQMQQPYQQAQTYQPQPQQQQQPRNNFDAKIDSTGFPSEVDFDDKDEDEDFDEGFTSQPKETPVTPYQQPAVNEWENFSQQRRQEPVYERDNRYNMQQQQPTQQTQPQYPSSSINEGINQPQKPVEEEVDNIDLASPMNVRYYKSDYTDLIELAKRIKQIGDSKDLEYAFTLYAGLSLHFLIKPFTVLNFYANPEDMQIWKDELRLVPVQRREDANIGIVVNTDIVFVSTKEIGGFKVVEDKVLLKDLSNTKEEQLVKQFRQHLTTI